MPPCRDQTPRRAGSRCSAPARRPPGSAARLRRLGFAVTCLPVMTVVPLAFTPKRTRYDAVIATSSKAFPSDGRIDRSVAALCVGARTARAAEAGGWRLAAPPAPDAEGLVEMLKDASRRPAVLYLAGRDRKTALEAALSGAVALEVARSMRPKRASAGGRPKSGRSTPAQSRCIIPADQRGSPLRSRKGRRGRGFRKMSHICLSPMSQIPSRRSPPTSESHVAATPERACAIRDPDRGRSAISIPNASRI